MRRLKMFLWSVFSSLFEDEIEDTVEHELQERAYEFVIENPPEPRGCR